MLIDCLFFLYLDLYTVVSELQLDYVRGDAYIYILKGFGRPIYLGTDKYVSVNDENLL